MNNADNIISRLRDDNNVTIIKLILCQTTKISKLTIDSYEENFCYVASISVFTPLGNEFLKIIKVQV